MESFSKDLFFTWQKNETTCGDDGMLFRIGKRKGGPPPERGHLFRLGCIVQLPTPPHTRKPATLFRPAEKPFQSGRSYPQSTRLYRAERAHQQAKRLLTTTSGRHLEDTALLPPPKNVSLRNGNGCGITSGIKRHFRLMNGTRKPILYAIGCFAGFYIL